MGVSLQLSCMLIRLNTGVVYAAGTYYVVVICLPLQAAAIGMLTGRLHTFSAMSWLLAEEPESL